MTDNGNRSQKRTAGYWCERWSLPYESAYGRLQKYKWLNVASNSALAYDLGLIGWCRPAYDLLDGDWIRLERRGFPVELKICEGLISNYGDRWPRQLSNAQLRYCLLCLKLGYHSIFFQFDFLVRCPIHDWPLINECQCCRQPTTALALYRDANPKRNREGGVIAFKCEACERPLIDDIDPEQWFPAEETLTSIHQTLTPIFHWLCQLAKEYPTLPRDPLPLNHIGLVTPSALESDCSALAHLAMFAVPLELPSHVLSTRRRPLSYHRVVCETSENREIDSNLSNAQVEADKYTKVRRLLDIQLEVDTYLRKSHLAAHQECMSDDARPTPIFRRLKEHEHLFPYEVRCTLAMAYVLWIFNFGSRSPYLYRDYREIPSVKNESIFYMDILADFYSSVVSVVAFTQRPPKSARSATYYDELLPHLNLPRIGKCTWCLVHCAQAGDTFEPSYLIASVDASVIEILRDEKLLACDRVRGFSRAEELAAHLCRVPDDMNGGKCGIA
jgi:hypothetical protein